PPEVADVRRGFVDQVIRTRQPLTTDDTRNGRSYFATYYPVLSSLGEVSAVAVIANDVTEMKQAQRLELALHNISETSHAALDLHSLLERVHRIIEELMPARNFFVAVYDEINQEISFPYFVDEHDTVPLPRKIGAGGLTETVLNRGEALLISAGMPESGLKQEQDIAGTRSVDWLGVPLKTEDRTIGVLAVQSYSGLVRYTDKDKVLLQFVSDQVAMAIQRMRTYSRLQLAANVFTYAQEGIIIADAAGNILEVNDTFTRITGYSRAEVIGKNPRMLKSGRHGPEFYAAMWADLKTKGHWYGEISNRRKNGEAFAEMLNISAVCDANGLPQHYVALFSDITALKEHQSQLERIAHYDALTGLPNRIVLADRLRQAAAQTRRRENLMALVYLDLDGFKAVNDSHGHETGDELLIVISQRLKEALREGDTLARIGGDEFVAVLTDLATPQECEIVVARLLQAAATPVQIKEHSLRVSASLGVTLFPLDSGDPDTLLRHADQAMYHAKQAGKNRYHLFDPERDQQARTHQEGFQRINQAYEQEEFVLHYQPKVNMRKGRVIGAEALIRWQHPERGLVPPGEFLPLIEESELISKVGDWVLDSALAQMAAWHTQGLEIAVSVNIAAFHLQQSDFLLRLREKLAAHPQLKAENLELEVLETAALEDILRVSQVIKDCQALGVNISLDDFGTGYSSLTYLKRLPTTVLKIDQSFVRDMLWDMEDLAIIEGVIGLAAAFHRIVIAEGIETAQHGQMLLKLGCDLGQGYGIARPMPAERLPEWVQHWRPDPSWADCGDAAVNRDELPLVHAEVDHRYWVKCMENFLADLSDNPPTFDSRRCRFGAWYHGEGRSRYGYMPEFQVIDAIHEQVHQLGRELLAHKSAARNAEAQTGMAELNALRDVLLGQLHALSAAMGKNRSGLQTRQEGQS
ncbi:MAG: EAL domain-containing protein, partial [Proteobacteria bacterium]|nr:EAL domain-containing protein [Pseudomonadota bacterium]